MDDIVKLMQKVKEDESHYNIMLLEILNKVNGFDTPYLLEKNVFPKIQNKVNDFDTPMG